MPVTLPPKRQPRRNKVQAFLTDDDFQKLQGIARSLKEGTGSLAARVLSGFASDCAHLAEGVEVGAGNE